MTALQMRLPHVGNSPAVGPRPSRGAIARLETPAHVGSPAGVRRTPGPSSPSEGPLASRYGGAETSAALTAEPNGSDSATRRLSWRITANGVDSPQERSAAVVCEQQRFVRRARAAWRRVRPWRTGRREAGPLRATPCSYPPVATRMCEPANATDPKQRAGRMSSSNSAIWALVWGSHVVGGIPSAPARRECVPRAPRSPQPVC
jgi:hypothetical protein